MLNLLCPHCYKMVSFPASAAGTEAPCPDCGKPFPIPAKYTPTVSPPPVPPPPAPRPTEPALAAPTHAPDATLPTGYTRSRGFTISPCVVSWIPVASLTAILLLTFLPWVGVYPGGHPVYTQGAWRAVSGWPTRSIQLEDLMLKELPPPSVYDRTPSDWFIMLPYLFVLFLAVAVAWAERIDSPRVAERIPALWPIRSALLAGLAGAALVLVSVEAARGFGLERAMHAAVSEKFADERQKAATTGEREKVDFKENQELAKFELERTGWFCLVLTLHVVALLAMLGRVGLDRRGSKPPPRIVFQY